jgi:FkbM family methyltransferase
MPASELRTRFELAHRRADLRAREVAKAVLNYHGQRRAMLRRFLFDAVSPFTPAVAVERNGITYFLNTADKVVSRDAFGSGSYSEEELGHTIAILEAQLGRRALLRGKTFVDVGANIGTTVIPAVKLFGAANGIAIEPEPANYTLLQCNLVANELADRVRCHQLALSDRSGNGVLDRSAFNSGDNRLRVGDQPTPLDGSNGGGSVPVKVATLDGVLRQDAVTVDDLGLVWIDAQGHEAHILAGATVLTASNVPVVIEYWPHGLQLSGRMAPLNRFIEAHYRTVIDLRASIRMGRPVLHSPASLARLASSLLRSADFTNLILVQQEASP